MKRKLFHAECFEKYPTATIQDEWSIIKHGVCIHEHYCYVCGFDINKNSLCITHTSGLSKEPYTEWEHNYIEESK